MLVVLNLPLIGIWVKLLQVPYRLLYPAILLFCCIGVYSINNNAFDVFMTALFGVLGYLFFKLDCEPAPLLLGFILGPMMEENLRRALLLSRGDPTVFVTRPMSRGHAAIAVAPAADHRGAVDPQEARGGVPGRRRLDARMPDETARIPTTHPRFDWTPALPVAAPAGLRAQRRRDLAAARRAGRHRDARQGRQRGRRGARHRDHADRRRAVQQRPRLRPLRDPVDGQRARRTQRVGPRARGLDAVALRGPARRCPSAAGRRSPFPARCPAGARCRSASASCPSPTSSSRRSATRATASRCRRSSPRNGRWRCRTCRATSGWFEHFMPRGRAPLPGERWSSRGARRARSRRSRRPTARRSIAASSPQAMVRHAQSAHGRARARGLRGAHAPTG